MTSGRLIVEFYWNPPREADNVLKLILQFPYYLLLETNELTRVVAWLCEMCFHQWYLHVLESGNRASEQA